MKKKTLCWLFTICTVITQCTISVHAETDTKSITFRDIPWYSTKTEVEKILLDDGATIGKAGWEDYVLRMSGIDHTNVLSGSDYIDGGGFMGSYNGISVAGYNASDTRACYLFTIDQNGNINKSVDDAEFYFGWYVFDSNDFVDGEGIYYDLNAKLSSLYGEGTVDDENQYHTTTTWYDIANNQIRLLLGGKDSDKKYVTLGYITADADARLDEMQAALDAEAAAAEAAEREANKENLSGL